VVWKDPHSTPKHEDEGTAPHSTAQHTTRQERSGEESMDPFQAALAALSAPPPPPSTFSGSEQHPQHPQLPPKEDSQRKALLRGCEEVNKFREEIGRASRRGPGGRRVLALMFLIIDALPHEDIWRAWIDGGEAEGIDVHVVIHAKNPDRVESDWVRSHMLRRSHRPKWGSIELTRAMIDLIVAALGDKRVGRLLLASETCIPIAPLREVGFQLWREEKSWIDFRTKPDNGYDRELKWGRVSAAVPLDKICKGDQWICLLRQHAEDILAFPRAAREELWPLMRDVVASDEIYIPTALNLLGEIRPGADESGVEAPRVARRKLTWGDWSVSAKSPATFTSFEPCREWPKAALEAGCLLARKFAPGSVTLEEWKVWNEKRLGEFNDMLDSMPDEEKKSAWAAIEAGEEAPDALPNPPWENRRLMGGGGRRGDWADDNRSGSGNDRNRGRYRDGGAASWGVDRRGASHYGPRSDRRHHGESASSYSKDERGGSNGSNPSPGNAGRQQPNGEDPVTVGEKRSREVEDERNHRGGRLEEQEDLQRIIGEAKRPREE
jgi:hypothetical protein